MTQDEVLKQAKKVAQQLLEKYHPKKVILFGSAASNDLEEPNDLDFFLIKDQVPQRSIDRAREVDRLIDREVACDFIVYTQQEFDQRLKLKDPFINKTIASKGIILYG
ncbi:nucleotidyltransferase domain-containing protein [Candidatus Woesebacteria bacterium]|nr:nucleotidyltransferase domain-containing protein [Candidatus Woesebacteria bacterium]